MNELDSSIMAGILIKRGLKPVADEDLADLLLFNTCSVRELAERKVIGKVGLLGRVKKENRIIGITGCMANAKKGALLKKMRHVDFILGPNNIQDLNTALDLVIEKRDRPAFTNPTFTEELDYSLAKRTDSLRAYVSIIRGCSKFCTYCIVPYTRGPEVSRHPDDILKECEELLSKGYKEIALLGQNVNSYGKDQPDWKIRFHDLLYRIDKLPEKKWVRFLTSHPVDITDELIFAMRDLPSLCEHLHFPLQAGSDRILKKMHRIYTKREYFEKVKKIRQYVPQIALGTDMIVGFPTETEEEFLETYNAMKELRYAHAFLYTFSPRQNTPAYRFGDDIPLTIKEERHQRVLKLHEEIASEIMQEMLGATVEVLVERTNRDSKQLKGVTRSWHNVIFEGNPTTIGTFQKVTLHSLSHQTFIGKVVE